MTLNLTGAEVFGGADALADFLMNEQCAVELCLVDNPRLGVHMADTGVAARDIPDRGEDEPVTDGGGTVALARALAENTTRLRRLNPQRLRPRRRSRGGARRALAARDASPSLESINLRSNDVSDSKAPGTMAAALSTRGGCPLKRDRAGE